MGVSRVCLLARRPGPLAKAKEALEEEFSGVEVYTHSVSLTDYVAVQETVKQLGQVDVLALSAVSAAPQAPLDQVPVDAMKEGYDTNVIGNWNLVNAVISARSDKSKQTIIVNVSSASAYSPLPRQGLYGSSKAAFAQLMTEFAKEMDEKEVRFVSYHPGAMYTELASKNFSKDFLEEWESVELAGRFAVWLASSEADFLNGRFVWAQWDVDELIELKEKIKNDPSFLRIGLVQ